LALDFFHSRFGSGRGGDTGGVPAADSVASSRALFFPLAAFAVGEGFILQVHGVFTRIRSGATAVASYGGAIGSTILSAAAVCTGGDFWLDPLRMCRLRFSRRISKSAPCGTKSTSVFKSHLKVHSARHKVDFGFQVASQSPLCAAQSRLRFLSRILKYLGACRMDLRGPTTSVGTRTDYSVGPWDYPTCAARHLMA
jgi:hypothetical protein